jgi:predicted CXXCH cytochrome family protein
MKRALLAAAFLAADAFAAGQGSVVGSKHDLSVSGPGPIKALREANPCVFCHTLHGGGKGLSNRPDPVAAYRPYESSTLRGRPSAPTGASRVCLSCHDGTIAVGQTRKGRIEMVGAGDGKIPGSSRSNLGTDLRQSHPFSIPSNASPGTRNPPHGRVKLDAQALVQCTSCHDPHSEYGGTVEGKFLVQPTSRSALCTSCHSTVMTSGHLSSTQPCPAPAPGETAYPTVAEAGCMACHRSHGAAAKGQLLRLGPTDPDEVVCLRCHSAGNGGVDVAREMAKPSSHTVAFAGVHDAAEGPTNPEHRLPEVSVGARRHATCVDCHDPHEAKQRAGTGQLIAGALDGVWGIDDLGRRVEVVQFEYQICFKCHGDSANQPSLSGSGALPGFVRRAAADPNLRRVFATSAPSSHPVVASGRNPDVPSLRPPLSVASRIRCSDCHASDDGAAAGGAGPRGPHGSIYRPLLERSYSTADMTVESPGSYALCYKCHDRDVLLSTSSAFRPHRSHVVTYLAPCSACHSAHGVSATSGSSRNNAHLIDFDLSIVRPGASAPYTSDGPRTGSCSLTCHGRLHDALRY